MNKTSLFLAAVAGITLSTAPAQAAQLMSVAYGTITGVNQQERDTSGARTGGALVGGVAGLLSGSGRSTSNKALRTLGGAAVGSAAGGAMARGTELVYTVGLVSGGTIRVVMDSGNFHRGDCVAVERGGASANMRRVSQEYCVNSDQVPAELKQEHKREANECNEAKQQLLAAETEQAIKAAQMKMNILCQD